MAKTTAPLLSFDGSGAIAKTQVYANWRGVAYARRYVVPANPNTTGQQSTRSVFAYLSAIWKQYAADSQAPWTAAAKGRPFTNRNKIISVNLPLLRGETDNDKLVGSPGANGGLAPTAASAAAVSTAVTLTLTAPTLPTDWTITKAVGLMLIEQNPTTATDFTSTEASVTAAPYAISLTAPDTGTYVVMGWFEFSKSDSTTAYGPSLTTTVTVS